MSLTYQYWSSSSPEFDISKAGSPKATKVIRFFLIHANFDGCLLEGASEYLPYLEHVETVTMGQAVK
jgi:hypothetical protein